MSYPGYPYYQGGGAGNGGGGMPPYPQQPFPGYPGQPQPSYPAAGGYGYGAPPAHMPMPYSMPMPGGGGGAPAGGGYPPAGGGYPPAPQHHQPTAAYPPPQPSYGGEYVPPPSHAGMYHSPPPAHNPYAAPAPAHGHYSSHSQPSHAAPRKSSPTVLPAEPFDPRADAETLRKAMKGFGTDEKAIIQVLAYRTNAQRLEIGVQFKTLYGKDLNKDLKSELSGRFEDLVLAMMMPLPQFYAKEVHEALSGIGTDEDTLIEVFCTMTNNEIRTIRAAYEAMYHRSLEDDLSGDTSGTFRRLMVSLCTANRDESMMVDPAYVTRDTQALLQAGELRLGTDESTFNAVLCQRNYLHLQAVFAEYERVTGHPFEQAVKNEFSGDAEEGLLAIVRTVRDKATFFAKRLHESMKGAGTNDRQLIRLVVTRSEVDMGDIKQAYLAKYGKSLEDAISGDTSGDYKKCLLALITI